MHWVLVLILVSSNGTSIESIKQPYNSAQTCKEAGEVWVKKIDAAFRQPNYACIPQ